nr:MAG TPA: hypothetical protein [Caudoviricetes sp.]
MVKKIKNQDKRKEKNMEGMTNEQFKIVLKMIIEIIKNSETKEEMIKKIEDLMN